MDAVVMIMKDNGAVLHGASGLHLMRSEWAVPYKPRLPACARLHTATGLATHTPGIQFCTRQCLPARLLGG